MITKEQIETYNWLKKQEINTDDDTLNFWARKYSDKRLKEVVSFVKERIKKGQKIKNIGGWIHKFLKTGIAVENEECKQNQQYVKDFIKIYKWEELQIYEKYIRDNITGDDLPLTMEKKMFIISLKNLYEKSQVYKN